nr:MAG TPA: hypothetical protein [Caudoviricetes sp.]
MTRDELVQKITSAKAALPKAGSIHKRDLGKHIHRLEKELRMYDFYQAQAKKSQNTA